MCDMRVESKKVFLDFRVCVCVCVFGPVFWNLEPLNTTYIHHIFRICPCSKQHVDVCKFLGVASRDSYDGGS